MEIQNPKIFIENPKMFWISMGTPKYFGYSQEIHNIIGFPQENHDIHDIAQTFYTLVREIAL